jgi:LysR family glycine cleavage system transcriptional activator
MIKGEETDPLPPLEWLRVFEAAGRLQNFTAAANELGLTQAAVSQRMKNLEAHLDTHLFLRLARGVELTADGEAYLPHVKSSFDAIRRGTTDLFASPRTKITIAAPASIAALWIAPRLNKLKSTYPSLQVSLSSVHRPTDFDAVKADLEVRFESKRWQRHKAVQLYTETLVPACSPDLLATATKNNWQQLPFIAVSGPRDGWHEWSVANGHAPVAQPSFRFDSMIAAQQAALCGAGVFLASLPLARDAIDSGTLVKISEQPLVMNAGYWLTWPRLKLLQSVEDAVVSTLTS